MLDFTNAPDQSEEKNYGPVPSGSIVLLRLEVLNPRNPAPMDPNISRTASGLYQLYCRFTVDEGQFQGVHFNQGLTLPEEHQKIQLSSNQRTACSIGAAQFKAICLAAKINLRLKSWLDFSGRVFPAKLKIRKEPNRYEGREYWNNEISRIITPDKPEYGQIQSLARGRREIINPKGAVIGGGSATSKTDSSAPAWDEGPSPDDYENDMPF